jgi:hypothetical protein
VKVSKAVLNIYSAMTIYFYLDAERSAGQVSQPQKNEKYPSDKRPKSHAGSSSPWLCAGQKHRIRGMQEKLSA